MKIGRGRYKLILNPDSRLMPKSIVMMVSFLKKSIGVGIVGPLVLNEAGLFNGLVGEELCDLLLCFVIF